MSGGTKPAGQLGLPTIVPATPPATELAAVVPLPSLRPQRPMRPVPLVTSRFLLSLISCAVRAWSQIRTSSTIPAK